MGKIRSYRFSDNFNYKEIMHNAIDNFRTKVLKDALIIEKDGGHGFIFEHGIAVFWEIDDTDFILQKLTSILSCKIDEELDFVSTSEQRIKIESDTVFLDSTDELTRLSVSFAIAQSIKLGEFEDEMLHALEETDHIPKELAKYGKVSMNRKEIAKERGRLFLIKSKIYLHFELLDTPEFLWEYPELETYYLATRKYMELQSRVEILHRKLSILQEILTILADEQNHKHSSLLEWIIIILIAFEIILFIVYDLA